MHLQAFKICVFIYLFFNTNDSILYTSVLKLAFFFHLYHGNCSRFIQWGQSNSQFLVYSSGLKSV